jgi:hypothetical protein
MDENRRNGSGMKDVITCLCSIVKVLLDRGELRVPGEGGGLSLMQDRILVYLLPNLIQKKVFNLLPVSVTLIVLKFPFVNSRYL